MACKERSSRQIVPLERSGPRHLKTRRLDVKDVVSQDDMESAFTEVTATHRDTGKPVKFSGQCMIRVQDGKIAEAWNHYDFLNMYQQLGQVLTQREASAHFIN